MSDNITKRVGLGTAYGFAKAGGYEGTVAEFTELLGNIAIDLARIENLSVTVTTLPAGSQATASLNGSVLSLGIPKGDKGDKGNTGDTGSPAGFGTVSATVDANIGTPSVEVTASGSDTAKNFAFAFHNLKGQKGDKGDTGEVSEAELTQAFEDFSANGTVANAEQLTTDIRANDQTPYLFRTAGGSVDIGDREYINGIVGGTVAFNQQFDSDSSKSGDGVTIAFNSTTGLIEFSGTSTTTYRQLFRNFKNIKDHIYFVGLQVVANPNNIDFAIGHLNTNVKAKLSTGSTVVKCSSTSNNAAGIESYSVGTVFDGVKAKFMTVDLTQALGSTIADYIYSLEQANAGAGVAFFKSLFPKPYYAYNAGELMSVKGLVSHDMVGFNAWDEEWELGYWTSDGEKDTSNANIRSKNKIPVIANTVYYCKTPYTYGIKILTLDANGSVISILGYKNNETFTTPSNCTHIVFYTNGSDEVETYSGGICINLSWDGSEDGNYEPYQKWSYPLDSDLELRGIPKIDNGNLYYDGDVYEADGTVTRKYGIVDLGTLTWNYEQGGSYTRFYNTAMQALIAKPASDSVVANIICAKYTTVSVSSIYGGSTDKVVAIGSSGTISIRDISAGTNPSDFKTAMSGVYLVYELATPTTETADPYTNPQIVNDFGTEEFVISNTVAVPIPVGHNTDYPVDLKAKVEMAPNSPDGDGDYIVRQTNGTNEYVSIANNATIQNILARLEALEG